MKELIDCLQKLGFDRVANFVKPNSMILLTTNVEMAVAKVLRTYFNDQTPLSVIQDMPQDYRKAENRALRYVDALRRYNKGKIALDEAYAELEAANKIDDRGAIDNALATLVKADRDLVTYRLSLYEQESRMKDLASSLLPPPEGTGTPIYPDDLVGK